MTWLDVGGQKSKVKVTRWFKYVVMKTSRQHWGVKVHLLVAPLTVVFR